MSGKYKKRKIISQVSTAPQSENSPNLSSSSRNSLGTSDKSLNKTKKAPHGVISHLRGIQLMVFASATFILSKIQHTKWLFLPYLRFEVSVLFFLRVVLDIPTLQAQHVERKQIRLRKMMASTIHRIATNSRMHRTGSLKEKKKMRGTAT